MTEKASSFALTSAEEVALCVERLVQETTEDLRKFRAEQSQLRCQIREVVNENHHLTGEVGKYKQQIMTAISYDDLKQRLILTSDGLAKAMEQISSLQKERHNLQQIQICSQKTIKNLETELNTYRSQMPLGNQEKIENYTRAIKMLEAKVAKQQEEIRSQSDIIKTLRESKHRSVERIEYLQGKLKDRHRDAATQEEIQSRVKNLQKNLKDCEKALIDKCSLLDESVKREGEAMRKVQEALAISAAAQLEKEDLERRAASYKEEATTLAVNIGSIMEEAAKRVDNEVEQLKEKLTEKDKNIAALRKQLTTEAAAHKTTMQSLDARYKSLTKKHKEALKQIEELEVHVEDCKTQLMQLEQCASNDEENTLKSKEEYAQMAKYLHAYKELKANYDDVLKDLTSKFEMAYDKLRKEKGLLEAENEMLKNLAGGDGINQYM